MFSVTDYRYFSKMVASSKSQVIAIYMINYSISSRGRNNITITLAGIVVYFAG